MKKLLLSMAGCMAIALTSMSQTTLFQDNFELGSGNWTLNSGGFGANDWIVNNVFFGSWLTNTPTQPVAITNSPQSQYLHIYNAGTACGGLGDCQAVFLASSGGDKTAEMVAPISTVGQTGVTFDFWYLCMGAVTTYGTVDYSLDGGSTWTSGSPNYQGMMQWTNQALTNPLWDNQPSLKFRFHWYESTTGNDPAYSVDQVHIYSTGGGASNTITTGTSIVPTSWCEGTMITTQVDFTSTGTYNVGNIYTAELSDAAGSFASPVAIGTLASTANSGLITATILGSVIAGTGYRIRVVSSDPVVIGSDNGSDLVVNPLPAVTLQPFADLCDNTGLLTLTGGSPAAGTYVGAGVSGGVFDPTIPGAGTTVITYNYTDANSCSSSANGPILVLASPTVTLQPFASLCVSASPITLTGGSPAGGTYSGSGVSGVTFDPAIAGIGTTTIIYTFSSANGCSNSALEPIVVSNGATVTQQPFVDVCEDASPVNIIGGSPAGGIYSGTGVSGTLFDPSVGGQGSTDITYTYTDANGCTGSAVEPVLVIPSPTVTLDVFADVCNTAAFFTLTGGMPAGGTYTGAGVTAGIFDPALAGAGTHSLTYYFTDGNGCSASAIQTIIVGDCSGIGEFEFNPIVLYPNPVSQSFQLISSLNIEGVYITDMSGRLVKSFEKQIVYDVTDIPTGVYIVTVHSSEGSTQLRIVVE